MGICGRDVSSFKDANLACCVGINLDMRYPHVFFDVVKIDDRPDGRFVTLESHGDGSEKECRVAMDVGQEYAIIHQKSPLCFWSEKPERFKIIPFLGKRL